jgi:hypothetical protein
MDTITWSIAWNIWLVFDNVTILVRRLEEIKLHGDNYTGPAAGKE